MEPIVFTETTSSDTHFPHDAELPPGKICIAEPVIKISSPTIRDSDTIENDVKDVTRGPPLHRHERLWKNGRHTTLPIVAPLVSTQQTVPRVVSPPDPPVPAHTSAVEPVVPSHSILPVARTDDNGLDVNANLALGDSSLAAYWAEGHLSELARAVSSFRSALHHTQDGSEAKIKAEIGLADALRLEVYEGIGGVAHRAQFLSLAESAVAGAGIFPTLYPDAVRALGEALLDPSQMQTAERLQRAVDTLCRLVYLTSDSPFDTAVRALALYATALYHQWLADGDSTMVELANSAVDRAMILRRDKNLTFDPVLGRAFMQARKARFTIRDSAAGSAQVIEISERFVSNCLPRHPLLPELWLYLGNLCGERSSLAGDTDGDRARALHAYGEARKLTSPAHCLRQRIDTNYAFTLSERFWTQSLLSDLNEAIAISRDVVSRLPGLAAIGYSARDSHMTAINLAAYLTVSYTQCGDLDTLSEAVALQLDILTHVPPVLYYMLLNNLGATYRMRYNAHGRMADLEKSISLQETAIRHPGASSRLHSEPVEVAMELAESLLARFEECGELDDVQRVVSVLREAVNHPMKQTHKGALYSLLGEALLKKGTVTETIQDIQESIRCQLKALDLLTQASPKRHHSYHRLGLAEYRAFQLDQQQSAIRNSITAYNSAISVMPPHHPDRAVYLSDLATSQLAATDPRLPEQVTAILEILGEAALHMQSWPADRYAAAALWARTAHRAGRLEIALDAYRLAISLLPQVAWLGLEDELRLRRLSRQPPDISQDAAACAIELGLYELAVEIIDGSRAILWNTSQELRTELGRLREAAPELARELTQTNAALAFRPSAVPDDEDPRKTEAERRRIHRLATRRTELLSLVRSIAGFQHFLLPPSYEALRCVSRDGPVVILISSSYRCDALVLRANEDVTLVPLPNVTQGLVLAQTEVLQKSLRLTGDRKGRAFLEMVLLRMLRFLWDRIGKPVCRSVGQQTVGPHPLRIWWCPTGVMTLLPLHACGSYNGVDPNMTDLFVSSYTPTLAALLRSRSKESASQPSSPPRMLVVCQPETLNRPPLPCAMDEARVLYSLLPSLCTFRIGPEGTVARVHEMLREHSWLHISSHGSQDGNKPLESSIALHDGDLKLSDMTQERMPNAEFAFLSACHSARGAESLPDEAMHLAAGMMFAGFGSVVATSWAIADKDAPVLVKAFYAYLARDGKTPKATETAEALHFAVKHLRDSGVPLLRWVPFIHLGG